LQGENYEICLRWKRGQEIPPPFGEAGKGMGLGGDIVVFVSLNRRFLFALGLIEHLQFAILSYNRFMNGWIKSKLSDKDLLKNVECKTFHQWSYGFGYDYSFDKSDLQRTTVVDLARDSKLKYQAILVDEAQDFYDEWFLALLEVLDKTGNSLFFVYDNAQSIYGQSHRRKSNWSWSKLGISVVGRSQIFDINYRNSPENLELAWKFIELGLNENGMKVETKEDKPTIDKIIKPKKKGTRSSSLQPSLLQINFDLMPEIIAKQVKTALESCPNSSIGILTYPQRTKSFRKEISNSLRKIGIEHHAPESSPQRNQNVVDRPYVIVDSWNALKGVEFDAVIIAGLDMAAENPVDTDIDFQEKAGIYTAMTRARDHLVMLYESETSIIEQVEHALNSPAQLESEN